jgi:anti-anti-sigma factor
MKNDLFSVSVGNYNHWCIISITGEFIIQNLFKVKQIFDEVERNNNLRIALDLSNATYLDSSAITTILNFHKRCNAKGGTLVLLRLNKDIEEIISILGIDKYIKVAEDLD